MRTNPDFRDLFAELNAAGVEYLVVGAHALAAHGHVRATKDLDVWIHCNAENAARAHAALCAFGAPVAALSLEDLGTPGIVFQIGVPPVRVDILTSIDGVSFDDAWQARVPSRYGDQPIQVISREHLISNKLASGRLQDLADVERLGGPVPDEVKNRRT
ncbi:nucleotidyltransferase [Sorangium sp. So ce119]|uniref:nucleotidyltransferase n=1 Tax=Sorangium sp. So ce119 TaxID=3133279 RepID=UPI003F5ECCD2